MGSRRNANEMTKGFGTLDPKQLQQKTEEETTTLSATDLNFSKF